MGVVFWCCIFINTMLYVLWVLSGNKITHFRNLSLSTAFHNLLCQHSPITKRLYSPLYYIFAEDTNIRCIFFILWRTSSRIRSHTHRALYKMKRKIFVSSRCRWTLRSVELARKKGRMIDENKCCIVLIRVKFWVTFAPLIRLSHSFHAHRKKRNWMHCWYSV